MKTIYTEGKDGVCPKCHNDFSAEEKMRKVPICAKCIGELVDIFKSGIDMSSIEEFSNDVSDFSDFVSSSARLMRLEDIVVVQVCFNIYMDGVRDVAKKNPRIARNILKDARRYIDIELERLDDSGENGPDEDKRFANSDVVERMMSSLGEMMKNLRVSNDGDGNGIKNCVGNVSNNKRVDNVSGVDRENDNTRDSVKGGAKDRENDNTRDSVKSDAKDRENDNTGDSVKSGAKDSVKSGAKDSVKSVSRRIKVN